MRCLKVFGDFIAEKGPGQQTAEIHIFTALVNHFNALGTAKIIRVA